MPSAIIVRLHPQEPTSGADFTAYLEDLVITAVDVSFDATEPREDGTRDLGEAAFDSDPTLTRIFQHITPAPQSVATAVIEVTQPWAEHLEPDVALRVERGGSPIAVYRIDYNAATVELTAAEIDDPLNYQTIEEVSLFFALPAVGLEIDPTDAFVELPPDGSPPSFEDLLGAVMVVLQADEPPAAPLPSPATLDQIRSLTPAQCRHIANEIAYNRRLEPLPLQGADLESMYTTPANDDARQKFEARQIEYYAKHDAVVERLYGYVVALSAALACEHMSDEAERVGLSFPVRVNPSLAETVREAKVVLRN